MISNGLRTLRTYTSLATDYQEEVTVDVPPIASFDIIMILGIIISVLLLAVIYFQMWKVESIEKSTLSIYAYLKLSEIQALHSTTQSYLIQITEGSFLKQILPDSDCDEDSKAK